MNKGRGNREEKEREEKRRGELGRGPQRKESDQRRWEARGSGEGETKWKGSERRGRERSLKKEMRL